MDNNNNGTRDVAREGDNHTVLASGVTSGSEQQKVSGFNNNNATEVSSRVAFSPKESLEEAGIRRDSRPRDAPKVESGTVGSTASTNPKSDGTEVAQLDAGSGTATRTVDNGPKADVLLNKKDTILSREGRIMDADDILTQAKSYLIDYEDRYQHMLVPPNRVEGPIPRLSNFGNMAEMVGYIPDRVAPEQLVAHGEIDAVEYVPYFRYSNGEVPMWANTMLLEEKKVLPIFVVEGSKATTTATGRPQMFAANVSPELLEALRDESGKEKLARSFSSLYGGKDYSQTLQLMHMQLESIRGGQNHTSLLMSMMRYYYAAVVGESAGGVCDGTFDPDVQRIIVAQTAQQWVEAVRISRRRIVRIDAGDSDYRHFVITTCQSGKSRYRCHLPGKYNHITVWDDVAVDHAGEFVVVVDEAMSLRGYKPAWPGNSQLIQQYITTYCMNMGLNQDANSAARLVLMFPLIRRLGIRMAISEPNHMTDLIRYHVMPTQEQDLDILSMSSISPLSKVLGFQLLSNQFEEAVGSWVESALSKRNENEPDEIGRKIILEKVNLARAHGSSAIIGLVSIISGISYDFLSNTDPMVLFFGVLRRKLYTPSNNTLEKMFLSVLPADSHAHWIRRDLVYTGSRLINGTYPLTQEEWYIMRKLKFEEEGIDITSTWDTFPYCNYDKKFLVPHPSKRLWISSIQGEKCQLRMHSIEFVQRTTMDVVKKMSAVETTAADILDALIGSFSMDTEYDNFGAVQGRIVESKMEQTSPTTVKAVEAAGEKKKEVFTALTAEEIRMADTADVFMRGEQNSDSQLVDRTANRIAMESSDGDEKAERIWNDSQPLAQSSIYNIASIVGDCGPVAFIASGRAQGFSGFTDLTVEGARSLVAQTVGAVLPRGRWWTAQDLIIAASCMGVGLVIQYSWQNRDYYHGFLLDNQRLLYISIKTPAHWLGYHPTGDVSKRVNAILYPPAVVENNDKSLAPEKKGQDALYKAGEKEKESKKTKNSTLKGATEEHESQERATGWRRLKKELNLKSASEVSWVRSLLRYKRIIEQESFLTVPMNKIVNLVLSVPWDDTTRPPAIVKELERSGTSVDYPGYGSNVARWVWKFVQIYDSRTTWNTLRQYHKLQQIPSSVLAVWHCVLFPYQVLPQDVQGKEKLEVKKLGCGCAGCMIQKRSWTCPLSDNGCHEVGKPSIKTSDLTVPLESLIPKTLGNRVQRKDFKRMNDYFPFDSSVGMRKTNLDVGSFMYTTYTASGQCQSMWNLLRQFCSMHIGRRNHFMTGSLLYLAGNTLSPAGMMQLSEMGFLGCCSAHWCEHMKSCHEEIRSNRSYGQFTIEPRDHSQLLYLDLLYGRLGEEVDWEKEEEKRTREREPIMAWDGEKWSFDHFKIKIREKVKAILAKVKRSGKLESLEENWDTRYSWMASGAATGKGKALTAEESSKVAGTDVKSGEVRGNKRSIAETKDLEFLEHYLKRKPFQEAYAHTKGNELAKTRSIFGVEMEHYVLHNYVLKKIEAGIRDKEISIREEPAQGWLELLQRREWCTSGYHCNSFDFSDFNDQHELEVMWIMHDEILNWYKWNYRTDENLNDVVRVGEWVRDSFMDTFYYDHNDKKVTLSGGMFSGNRGTTVINTVLNKAYAEVVEDCMAYTNKKTVMMDNFRTGDDVVSKSYDSGGAYAYNRYAMLANIDANPHKQLSDTGYMEYLRLMYYPTGEVYGSLCRAIGTLVNGNWESEQAKNNIGRAGAIWDQMSVLMRRGLVETIVRPLYEDLVRYYAKSIGEKESMDPSAVSIRREDGGLGLGELGSGKIICAKSILTKTREKKMDFRSIGKDKSKAASKYIEKLNADKFPKWARIKEEDKPALRSVMLESSIGLELPPRIQGAGNFDNKQYNSAVREGGVEAPTRDKMKGGYEAALCGLTKIREKGRTQKQIGALSQYYPYISYEAGFGKKDLIAHLTRGNAHSDLDELEFDRTDGGWVPPQAYSLLSSYAKVNNIDSKLIVNDYLAREDSRVILY